MRTDWNTMRGSRRTTGSTSTTSGGASHPDSSRLETAGGGRWRGALAALGLLLPGLGAGGTALSGDLGLEDLMSGLAGVASAQGRFTERRHVSLLSEPLELAGAYRYEAPDYLAKSFDDADAESYEVRGSTLRVFYPDGRRQALPLSEYPVLRAYVEGVRGTLAGDLVSLAENFTVELRGDAGQWRLHLSPRLEALAERVSEIVIDGAGRALARIESREANGDRSVMVLHPAGE